MKIKDLLEILSQFDEDEIIMAHCGECGYTFTPANHIFTKVEYENVVLISDSETIV